MYDVEREHRLAEVRYKVDYLLRALWLCIHRCVIDGPGHCFPSTSRMASSLVLV